jgi:predicted DsbA family dithiol-disulfide isomerase
MPTPLQLDYISDIACPWCAVGVNSLERALPMLDANVQVQLRYQPYELNPHMGAEGADTVAYLSEKYGISAEQVASNQGRIRELGARVGFAFGPRTRVWNTFDAHRLLHWAAQVSPKAQHALKKALLQAYHGDDLNPADPGVLRQAAEAAGLDGAAAQAVLDSDQHALDVRSQESRWQRLGIQGVPALVVNMRHLISGAQMPEQYAQALQQIANAPAEA